MSVVQMPQRSQAEYRRAWLHWQALYMVAEGLYRAVVANPRAELVDLHPVEAERYHKAARTAYQMVTK